MGRFACVGSRRLTLDELDRCFKLGAHLCREGHTITSGGALGADLAFMSGGMSTAPDPSQVEAYLPWATYNYNLLPPNCKHIVLNKDVHERWFKFAKAVHPSWYQLGNNGKMYHARNAGIVLGETMMDMVDMILAFPASDRRGGTEQSFRMADVLKIPLINLREILEIDLDRLAIVSAWTYPEPNSSSGTPASS